jgi:hypothetical protein
MANTPPSTSSANQNRFSSLLLEGLDHYRKGKMMEAVRAWEEAYLLEPTNLRAREFLRSALERIHAHMGGTGPQPSDLPALQFTPVRQPQPTAGERAPERPQPGLDQTVPSFRPPSHPGSAKGGHPWLPQAPPNQRRTSNPGGPPRKPSDPGQARRGSSPGVASGVPRRSDPGPARMRATPPSSPWDDGPSVALPSMDERQQPEGGQGGGVWGIHANAAPAQSDGDETDVWLRGARELVALNDFSGALELTGKILQRRPDDADALSMHKTCEENLIQMFESRLGSMDRRPKVAIKPDEVIWLNLDPRAGFVLAQIDGEVSFEDLYAICGLSRLDTARILSQLLEEGVVAAEANALQARAGR